MSLGSRQRQFSLNIAKLIIFAHENGYGITFGDAYRDPRMYGNWGDSKGYSSPHSVHKIRLAVDLNLFEDGEYLTGDDARLGHGFLHDYWDTLNGSERIRKDLNHYSFTFNGFRKGGDIFIQSSLNIHRVDVF